VGKTVLLNKVAQIAETERCLTVSLEAPEDAGLAQMLVPPLRSVLIKLRAKGMLYSPQYGDTAFTGPMFDEFMKRMMPVWRP
jgi:hypothetical protein